MIHIGLPWRFNRKVLFPLKHQKPSNTVLGQYLDYASRLACEEIKVGWDEFYINLSHRQVFHSPSRSPDYKCERAINSVED